jgi:hypothetical protein
MKAKAGGWWLLRSLLPAILVLFVWIDGVAAVAVESFALPQALPPGDDGSSAAVPIGFPINFFGVTYTELFVNNNGNVTFGTPLSTFTPFGLVGTRQVIIAPFFADVDTRAPGSGVVRFGTPAGRADLFVVDWCLVGYYSQHDDTLNCFQLILQDLSAVLDFVPGDFRIVFNYDQIRWETGDASGGTQGLGGSSARVGFSNGSGQPGTFFELPGSGENGALLAGGSRSLVGHRVPAADPSLPLGRYQFVVRNGAIAQADLAIAAEIVDAEDETGFDLTVRNFGPSDATPVQVSFELRGGGRRARIRAIRPRGVCDVDDTFGLQPPREATCNFPRITSGASQRIRVITSEAVRGTATVASNTFDSDLSNNRARASSSCRGEILSRSAPESVLYEPTATEPATEMLRLAIINTAADQRIEIHRLILENIYTDPLFGTPLQIIRIRPRLPKTIEPGGSQVFRVVTLVPAGMPARTAFRPYFQFRVRCLE